MVPTDLQMSLSPAGGAPGCAWYATTAVLSLLRTGSIQWLSCGAGWATHETRWTGTTPVMILV